MKRRYVALAAALLAGCAGSLEVPRFLQPGAQAPAAKPRGVTQQLLEDGLDQLARGDNEAARRRFAAVLKLDPRNAQAHFLVARLQQRSAEGGEQQAADLAEVGYLRALEFDPTFWPASHALGRLYLHERRYGDAQARLSRAAVLKPGDADILNDLATASYYLGDLSTAMPAVREARRLKPASVDVLRTEAFVFAAAGDRAAVADAAGALRKQLPASDWPRVERRLGEWAEFHSRERDARDAGSAGGLGAAAIVLAQADTSTDNSGAAPALPPIKPPAGGKSPAMVQVDVVMIRTEEVESGRRGVNLLEALTLQFGGSNQATRTNTTDALGASSSTFQRVITRTLGIPDILYSINIANDSIDYASVVARPSLVAMDGQAATFFSGEEVSLALPGNFAGNIQDKNIGVSLAVTPTFISGDAVLLAVAASRSFVNLGNPVSTGTFQQSLQTTKQAVNTAVALKFGETLILSGLSERQSERQSSGVPVLGDVPLLQYLFKQTNTLEYTKSVLILLTPRAVVPLGGAEPPPSPASAGRRTGRDAVRDLYAQFPSLFRETANVDLLRLALQRNTLLNPMRPGDLPIHDDPEAHAPRTFAQRLRELIYY